MSITPHLSGEDDRTGGVECALKFEGDRRDQLRLSVLHHRIAADFELGRHEFLVSELTYLTDLHPLREQFHAQLMRALYLSGRRAEALEAFLNARRVLVDHAGVEPGVDLQELHRQILAGTSAYPVLSDRGSTDAGCRSRAADAGRRRKTCLRTCAWTETKRPGAA